MNTLSLLSGRKYHQKTTPFEWIWPVLSSHASFRVRWENKMDSNSNNHWDYLWAIKLRLIYLHESSFTSPFCCSYSLGTAKWSVSDLFLTDAEVSEIDNLFSVFWQLTNVFFHFFSSNSMYHIMLKGCYSGVAWLLALLREKWQKRDG